jgi:hypothetical protein
MTMIDDETPDMKEILAAQLKELDTWGAVLART